MKSQEHFMINYRFSDKKNLKYHKIITRQSPKIKKNYQQKDGRKFCKKFVCK